MTAKNRFHAMAAIAVALTIAVAADSSLDLGPLAKAGHLTAAWPNGRPIIVTDLSEPSAPVRGRGVDIAAIDGQIGPAS